MGLEGAKSKQEMQVFPVSEMYSMVRASAIITAFSKQSR